jgi:peptide-methionine (S)-S-oxide reductase
MAGRSLKPSLEDPTMTLEQATLGGGCFWCLEAVFQQMRGVERVESGYCGGSTDAPTYRQVCEGNTGHAEVVQVTFDPAVVSYREILEVFFAIHDPTTLDRQGHDVGTQYRSIIFWHSPQQQRAAQEVIADLTAQQVFDRPIVTQLAPHEKFFQAEDYHQNYFREHPEQAYCRAVISPKVVAFRRKFAERLKR